MRYLKAQPFPVVHLVKQADEGAIEVGSNHRTPLSASIYMINLTPAWKPATVHEQFIVVFFVYFVSQLVSV